MFKDILNFGIKRSIKNAFGFYLSCLLLNILIGITLAFIFVENTNLAFAVGSYGVVVVQFVLGILLLRKRNRMKNFWNIVLVILAIFLTRVGGALFGLIPLAYLSTK